MTETVVQRLARHIGRLETQADEEQRNRIDLHNEVVQTRKAFDELVRERNFFERELKSIMKRVQNLHNTLPSEGEYLDWRETHGYGGPKPKPVDQ